MICNSLNFDNAPSVDVIGKEYFPFQFTVTYPDIIDLTGGTYRMVITSDEYGECPVLTINDLDITGQVLTVNVPADHGLVWGKYYGTVVKDADDELNAEILKINLLIRPNKARPPL